MSATKRRAHRLPLGAPIEWTRMRGEPPQESRSSRLLSLIATILVIAALYWAREVLIPIALAMLLTFLLSPLMARLQRLGLSRVPAVMVVSVLAFSIIGVIGYVVTTELLALTESLPQYRENIREKVQAIARPGFLAHATESLKQATEEVMEAATQPAEGTTTLPSARTSPPEAPPLKVEVTEPAPNALETLAQTIAPLLGPLGTAGIIIIFVIFMLIQREDLRDRLIALSGTEQIHVTTEAIDDAAKRVSRFLLMQLIVNLTYGIAAGAGLLLMSVPNAILWGVLCVVLRYIPYAGPWLAAAPPIVLSLAVFDGWTQPLMVAGLFIVLEIVSNNVVEPLLYGSGTGVSPIAVLLAAVFWTWLWGISGLVLSTPLTVCVVVIGRHFPRARWLAVLLGDEPGLPLPARVYQRLLAADQEEVFRLAQQYFEDHEVEAWYDEVLLPALSRAETDRHEGTLDERREELLFTAARELIEDIGQNPKGAPGDSASSSTDDAAPDDAKPAPTTASDAERPLALIVAAHDQADELAGLMLAQVLTRGGQRAEALGSGGLAAEVCERAAASNPAVICVSSMPPMAVGHARYMCKRLRERLPEVRLVVGLWNASDLERAARRLDASPDTVVVATLAQAVEALRM